MGIGLWYEMYISNPVDYLFKNADPRGSLGANVSSATVRCLSNMPLANMLENRHGMSQAVRKEVSPKSNEWGYRLGSVYIRKVHFRDIGMIQQIEAKVVNRMEQNAAMVMLSVPVPAGFGAQLEDFDQLQDKGVAAKYQVLPQSVLIYLRDLPAGKPLELTYRLRATTRCSSPPKARATSSAANSLPAAASPASSPPAKARAPKRSRSAWPTLKPSAAPAAASSKPRSRKKPKPTSSANKPSSAAAQPR